MAKKKTLVMCYMSRVTYHMSHVACHLSPVICHLSLAPTATATDPPPANSPIIHSRLARKIQKRERFSKRQKSLKMKRRRKNCDCRPILAIFPSTRGLQSTGKWVFHDGMDTHTDGHRDSITESDRWADSVKRDPLLVKKL